MTPTSNPTPSNPTSSCANPSITTADLPLRDELRGSTAYGAPQLTVPVQINTNENPYPPSDALIDDLVGEIADVARGLNRYPDRDAVALRRSLAAYVTRQTGVVVDHTNLWAANGSNEVLHQLLQAFGGPGRTALGFPPSYSMHPILCAGAHTRFVSCPRREVLPATPQGRAAFPIDLDAAREVIDRERPDVIVVTTPNNPTGDTTSLDTLRELIDLAPGIVIVDEAYAEFAPSPSACTLLAEYPTRLVVSRTMSKAFDFAGARLGYLVAHPAVVEALLLVRLPYHLSSLTQAASLVALRHSEDTLGTVADLVDERGRVIGGLADCGITVVDSEANFVQFGHFRDSHEAWQAYLDRGVLVRDNGVAGWLRATIGLPEENDAFLAATREIAPEHCRR